MSAYTEEDLKLAVEKVKNGELSAYAASKKFIIPRTTIVNHVIGKNKGFKAGRPAQFSEEQEKTLIELIKGLSLMGYPLEKKDLKELSQSFAKEYEIKRNGVDWVPGDDWMYMYISIFIIKCIINQI
jgi:transposase